MGNMQEEPRKSKKLSVSRIIGLGMIAAIAVTVLIAALNGFGR
jgi:hypothetical protein